MEIYFDNSATTRCAPEVAALMKKIYLEDYGNPSSLHGKGLEAEQYIRKAREQIAGTLKVEPRELVFTSGGTEADNLAVIGSALANQRKGRHLITTRIEHPAVARPMEFLQEQGFTVDYLDVDHQGRISLDQLRKLMTPETILVSIMHVNNEIGTVEPIAGAAQLIKEINPETLFHVDAIQSYGKFPIYPKRMGIDMLSVSGHKIHGPKGVGFLFVKEKTKLKPLILGGGHQNGMRSGTENVPGVAGLGLAAQEACANMEEKRQQLYALRQEFIQGLQDFPWTHVNGPLQQEEQEAVAPHIVSVSFDGVPSEVLLHALEDKGIYVSAGSACSSNKPAISQTLKSIGLKKDYLGSTVRFSFSTQNTREEVICCLGALKSLVPVLQRYTRH